MNSNIVLIGPMGSGKSAVGRGLARLLTMDFIDSDQEIEQTLGVPINWIFDVEGEEGFREREYLALCRIFDTPNQVIATGGGIVTSERNRIFLKDNSKLIIFLNPPLRKLYARLARVQNRPLLNQAKDRKAVIRQLKEQREPWYREIADIEIDFVESTLAKQIQAVRNHIHD